MPTRQDFDALVQRLEALEAEIREERAARQALEEQLRQSRYEKGLRMALQSYKLSIRRSCKKDYLRYRPRYSCWLPFCSGGGIFNQPQATDVYGPPNEDIVEDPSR